MLMLINDWKGKKKIYDKDIQYYAHSLKDFVTVYKNDLYMINEKEIRNIEILENFANMLLQKRYAELFDPDVEIVYDQPTIDKSNYELPF